MSRTISFDQLNAISRLESTVGKLKDLEVNSIHGINNLKLVKTEYGHRVIATFENDTEFFLPKRISEALFENKEMYVSLNEKAKQGLLRMRYLGIKWNLIEFLRDNEDGQ